ncbi:hypothetical protein Tcan_08524, partial [Toxocara canis]
KTGSGKATLNEALVAIEPGFPLFAPRPSTQLPLKRTANMVLVNISSLRLIFKIEHSDSAEAKKYLVRPDVDYLPPHGCRSVTISILNDPPQPGKEHEFIYHIVPLGADDGLGMSAKEYWKSKNLDKGSDKRTQEGQFICIEPEPRSGNSMLGIRRQLSRPDVAARASLSTSVKDVMERSSHENTTFGQFVMKPAPSVVNKLVAVDEELIGPLAVNAAAYQRVPSRRRQADNESDEALRSVTLCKCQLSLESKRYFWQSAAAMRAFCYGFILALIPMGIIALKKSHA